MNRLHHRLSIYTLFFTAFLIIIAAGISFITEFNHSKEKTFLRLTQLMDTVESNAAIAAYTRDHVIANDVINGLLRNDIVYAASIISDQGVLAEAGKTPAIQKNQHYTRTLYSPFSEQQLIGQLLISPNTHYNLTEAIHAAYANALSSTALILAAAVIFLIVVRTKISLPLITVSNTLHAIKTGQEKRIAVIEQHKHDELGRLVNDINDLLKTLDIKLKQEQILRKSIEHMEKQLRHIYETSSAGLFLLDTKGRLVSYNATLLKVLNCKNIGHSIKKQDFASLFITEKHEFQLMLGQALQTGQLQTQDFLLQRNRTPKTIWIHCLLSKVSNSSGPPLLEGVIFDVSKRVITEQAIKYEAEHDSLTGLLRRQSIKNKFEHYMEQADTPEISLFLLDLDGFKLANDTYGHDAGDQILITVAKRLTTCVRASDLICRLGGDEFLVMVFNNSQATETDASIAKKIINSIQSPISINKTITTQVGISIGIANTKEHGCHFDTLVKSADQAMYEVKRQGKNGYAIKTAADQIAVKLIRAE